MKQILLLTATLALGACASPTAPVRHAMPQASAPHKDVVCWDASRSGYVVYSGDKCPAE